MNSDSKDPTIAPDYLAKQSKSAAEQAKEATEPTVTAVEAADAHPLNKVTYYYAVSTVKLIVLSTLTSGLYDIYWFYKNWVEIKRREYANITPWARALFSPLFAFSCFDRVYKSAAYTNLHISPKLKWHGIGYVFVTALYKLPDPYWWLSYGSVFFLVSANKAMADINAKTGGDEKPLGLHGWDWLLVLLGGAFMTFALIPESWIPQP
ncbi:MAG: hypothetical protein HND56_08340 [Pseudomonadota bacterium]|nr:hypothetical protein [Pseudomonadota bacterium]QKK05695.1 MAG: hypothetical protein HND56_08340 [Pseudomonadota bacterium]